MSSDDAKAPRRHLAAGALVAVAIQMVGIVVAAPTSIVIARAIGPEGTAAFGLSSSLIGAGLVVFSLGLAAAMTYYVSREEWAPRTALREGERVAILVGIPAGLVMLGAQAVFGDSFLAGVTWGMALALAIAMPFALAWSFACAVALSLERYEAYGFTQGLQAVGVLAGVLVLVWPLDALGAVIALAASYVVAYVSLRVRLLRTLPPAPDGPSGRMRVALGFGSRAWGADLLQLLNYRLDLFILNAYAASKIVGQYSVAVSLTAIGWVLPTALQTVLFPRTASTSTDADADPDATVIIALRHTLVLLTVSAVGVAVLVAAIPLLYGDAFSDAVGYGFLLLPGVLAIGFAKPLSAVLTGRGFPHYSLYNSLITAPLTVALYFLLVPRLEGTGAALSSTASYTLSMLLAIYFFKRATGIPIAQAFTSPRSIVDDYRLAARNLRSYIRALS